MTRARLTASMGVGLTALLCGVFALPASATGPVTTIVSGLGGPLHIDVKGKSLYVADTFGGQVLRVSGGTRTVLADKVVFSAVSVAEGGAVYGVIGLDPRTTPGLYRVAGGKAVLMADLLAYEKQHNPDGQPQQTGPKADALSDPYDVLVQTNRTLVADAAANDILSVTAGGTVRTLTVLPVSKKGVCATMTNNGVKNGGCDPVPTSMTVGPDGYLYVSGLGAEVEGHVWKIDQSSGKIVQQWDGLPPLTGIAAGSAGNLYVCSLFTNQIFRLGASGAVTGVVKVTGPSGLQVSGGQLYAGSVVQADNAPPKGYVVRVPVSAFGR